MNFRQGGILRNSSHEELFNFSYHQAVVILEEHRMKDSIFPRVTEISIIACYVTLMVSGVLSNILLSTVIMRNSKNYSNRNLYIVNLNASDVTLCLVCMPFTAFSLIRRSWPLGTFLCKFVPFLQGSTVLVSATTASAIAIDRCKAIVTFNPQKRKGKPKNTVLHLAAIWVFAVALSLPMCVTQRVIFVGLPGIVSYEKCIEHWPSSTSKGLYTLVILMIQFFIPTTVLAVTHFRVKAHLNLTHSQRDFQSPQMVSERLCREVNRNRRATMVLMNISIVFAISWLPWNALNLLIDFKPHVMSPQHLYLAFAVCHMMAMTSATTNPILYGWLNTNIRKELMQVGEKMGNAFLPQRSSHRENIPDTVRNVVTEQQLKARTQQLNPVTAQKNALRKDSI